VFKRIINTTILFVQSNIRRFSFDSTQITGELELISYTKSLAVVVLKERQFDAQLKLCKFKILEKLDISNFDLNKYNILIEQKKNMQHM